MKLEATADGSFTLRSPAHGDTYHSLRGAVGEAKHVFIDAGWQTVCGMNPRPLKILEMGFGSGLNAWLTLTEADATGHAVDYTAVEQYPVTPGTAQQLGYSEDPRFMALHTSPWESWNEPSPGFRLRKLQGDVAEIFVKQNFSAIFDLIYWDAFAPDTQPELWTETLFARVFEATAPGGVLVTYSAKGDVRRALEAVGFEVERIQGALGKRHMLRAIKL
ncbi:MAG: tRNA (5-methylaminomethyl-2-thiouridine)(34)-methyltransferase MnmD [Alistipes sp.]|jgi:tRNA U34 5-methylaminomethyl-2-thiouridine-forming methyltransferase MnmC|nr:tRNA (5-methylaminomethyl-2-thiouridine)(34)-methyltransferase MnmD [Alistipes sp.]